MIENDNVNFNDYKSCLLFTLRTIYNEKFRKEVNVDIYNGMLKSELSSEMDTELLSLALEQENLGIKDIESNENDIWKDLFENTQSFVFLVK